MIPTMKKVPAFLFAVILLLLLCNTPTVFASESPGSFLHSGEEAAVTAPAVAEPPVDSAEPQQETATGGKQAKAVPPEQALPDTGELPEPEPTDVSTPSNAGPPADNGTEAPSPPTTQPPEDNGKPPNAALPTPAPEEIQPDAASTAEQLLAWLDEHRNGTGTLKLTADIYLGDLTYMNNASKNLIIDTGDYSIIATGTVYFWCSGLTIRGQGGENGVLRAARGGALSIGYLTVGAEEGMAVVQEEGAGFAAFQCVLDEASAHYAQTPFVWEWKSPVVIVEPGQTAADVLPPVVKTYGVNRLGQMGDPEDVPVTWALAGHEASEEQRLRFEAEGSTPGFAFLSTPLCTVVYNDYPLTFTWIEARETNSKYIIKGGFTKPEDRLPIEVSLEYSFDGEQWLPYETLTAEEDSVFYFSLRKDGWDVEHNPWLLLRIHWDDAGTHYYSNLLRFSGDNFGKAEDRGGNRGGGTDIVDPPAVPKPEEPDPPGTTRPPKPKPEEPDPPGITRPSKPEPPGPPNPTPEPVPEEPFKPEATEQPEPIVPSGEELPVMEPITPPAKAESGLQVPPQALSEAEGKTPDLQLDDTADSASQPTESHWAESHSAVPIPANSAGETPSVKDSPSQSEHEEHNPPAKAIPIAAGCIAIAAVIGAAGVYHSERLRKRLFSTWKKLTRRKK